MNTFAIERDLATKQLRRMRREARQEAVLERRESAADKMIGELCRDGHPVFYVYPVGGRYREGTRSDLIAFLLRNGYV
jgi:hypothetical protein